MKVYLVWQRGRSTASGQPMLLGVFSRPEEATAIAADGDRKVTEATVGEMIEQ